MDYVIYDNEYAYPVYVDEDEFGYEHEIILKIPVNWFKEYIKEEFNIDSMLDFFEEYTSEETEQIYWAAVNDGKIMPIYYFDYMDGELEADIIKVLSRSISSDYLNDIFMKIKDDIIDDVCTMSGWLDDGFYNDDNISRAIGRILIDELGIERD